MTKTQFQYHSNGLSGPGQAPAVALHAVDGVWAGHPRANGRHVAAHKLQKAKTLMRRAVSRPVSQPGIGSRVAAVATPITVPSSKKAASVAGITSQQRKHRAHVVQKSTLVSKFGTRATVVRKRLAPLAVKQPASHHDISTATHVNANPFAKALAIATSHEQQPLKKASLRHRVTHRLSKRTQLLGVAIASLLVIGVGGLLAYQNVPNLAMRVAAARAGFEASLPSYMPAGFALRRPIQYSPGQITLTFQSNSDERAFNVVQRPTNWNSESLRDSFVDTTRQPYLTYEDKGKTIYIYNGSDATWVNGGVWYKVESHAGLSSDQLLKIANSL